MKLLLFVCTFFCCQHLNACWGQSKKQMAPVPAAVKVEQLRKDMKVLKARSETLNGTFGWGGRVQQSHDKEKSLTELCQNFKEISSRVKQNDNAVRQKFCL